MTSAVDSTTGAPAAWYPDPQDSALVRWWDGASWTGHTRASEPEPEPELEPEPVWRPVGEVREPRFEPSRIPDDEPSAPSFVASRPEGFVPRSTFQPLPSYGPTPIDESPNSLWSWLLCTLPLLQAAVILLSALYSDTVSGAVLRYGLFVVPAALYVLLATRDAAVLRARGYPRVAAAWALLPLVYLSLRSMRVGRRSIPVLGGWLLAHLAPLAVLLVLLVPVVLDGLAVAEYRRGVPDGASSVTLAADERARLLTPDGMAAQLARDLSASGDIVDDSVCPPFAPADADVVTCTVTISGMTAQAEVQITDQYPTVAFVLLGLDWD